MSTISFSRRALAVAMVGGAAAVAGLASAQAADAPAEKYDLEPFFTVSGAKATGYAGIVALRIRNVGSARYYADFPAVSFKVEIKTEQGPEGVDRLITPGWFNGAYTRDLGFDPETGTRTFVVTLSNPILAGKEQLVANFQFGDGGTSEGRIINRIEVSQVGRLKADTSTANDQKVDSRVATRLDTGGKHSGLF